MKDLMYEIRNTKSILNSSLDRAKKIMKEIFWLFKICPQIFNTPFKR